MSERAASATSREQAGERIDALLAEVDRGLRDDWTLPAKVFNDPELHELEKQRVFGKSWVFLAHESEVTEPGDYVVRYIADDQFIVVRDETGEIRAHFNSCRHRGMQVCRAEMGNASHFRCPYHGWTYRNNGDLVGVPAQKEAYGPHLDKGDWGLLPIPRLGVYKGLVFGCMDADAMSLDDFLGDMRFYLDMVLDRSDAGLKVVGAPQRWIVDANWKLGGDNFIGDDYHTLMTHRSMVELGLAPGDPQFAMYGEHVYAGNGHGLGLVGAPPQMELPPYLGLPGEVIESLERRLSPVQAGILKKTGFLHGTVFPNLSLLNVWIAKDHQSPPTPMLTLRLWHPIGPDKMELWSWFLIEKDAPEPYRTASYQTYVHTFGTSGVFEQDDAENWRSITRVLRGAYAQDQQLNYQMGRGMLERDEAWPGPGEAYPLNYAEFNQRAYHRRWHDYMVGDPSTTAAGAKGGVHA